MTSAERGPGGPEAFVFVGGCPSLDLVATLGRRHAGPVERIPDGEALSRWFIEEGLLTDPPPMTDRDLYRARRLREAISAVVRSSMARTAAREDSLSVVNEFAAQADLPPRLAVGTAGRVVTAPSAGSPSQALATVARDAAVLLGGPRATRIKECAHPDCSLVFLDETQSGRRRWCSMDRCGNLVKIKGYRERRRAQGDAEAGCQRRT
jgi:predicted RNA-binding Zn ribbon-like protein